MNALEELEQPYLFKLRQSVGVKKLIKQQCQRDDWVPVGQGWQACDDELRLMGWTRKRRVVMRRQCIADLVFETPNQIKRGRPRKNLPEQAELHFIDKHQPVKSWEQAALVRNTDYEVEHIGLLYRDRADCENGFDEIKNPWGWGGCTRHDIERCALSARAVALICNWLSGYVQPAHPKTRLEAITSRPMLLAAVGRMTRHSRATKPVLAVTHEAAAQIKVLIANVRARLNHIRSAAPQWDKAQRWPTMLRYIVAQMLACQGTTRRAAGHRADRPTEENSLKASAKVARCFRRLHAHGLIAKISRTRRWRATNCGRNVMGTRCTCASSTSRMSTPPLCTELLRERQRNYGERIHPPSAA